MALIVEDGTGLADAESYTSVDYADAYFSARGVAAWSALDDTGKEQALRKATDYMAVYSGAWRGRRVGSTQALDWPRSGAVAYCYPVDPAVVPYAVQKACCILALKSTAGELAPDLERAVHSRKVGPLETVYDDYSPQTKRYASVDQALAPYLTGHGHSVPLRRA